MKKIRILIVLVIAIACITLAVGCGESDEFTQSNEKLLKVSVAIQTEVSVEMKTTAGDLLYEETSTYTRDAESVKLTHKAKTLNPDAGVGQASEPYLEETVESTITFDEYLSAIKAGRQFDASACKSGFSATSVDKGALIVVTFEIGDSAKATTLGITEEEANSISNAQVSIVSNATYVTELTVSYDTTVGNVSIRTTYTY